MAVAVPEEATVEGARAAETEVVAEMVEANEDMGATTVPAKTCTCVVAVSTKNDHNLEKSMVTSSPCISGLVSRTRTDGESTSAATPVSAANLPCTF